MRACTSHHMHACSLTAFARVRNRTRRCGEAMKTGHARHLKSCKGPADEEEEAQAEAEEEQAEGEEEQQEDEEQKPKAKKKASWLLLAAACVHVVWALHAVRMQLHTATSHCVCRIIHHPGACNSP